MCVCGSEWDWWVCVWRVRKAERKRKNLKDRKRTIKLQGLDKKSSKTEGFFLKKIIFLLYHE